MSDRPDPFVVDLTNCDREPIHIPGAIQPHGVLLVLAEPELTVTQTSEQVASLLGQEVDQILGRPLSDVLDAGSVERVRDALLEDAWRTLNPIRLTSGPRSFDGILHRHRGATILELEPRLERGADEDTTSLMRQVLIRLQTADSLPELFQTITQSVSSLTGFERVMIYRFDEEGNGEVLDETRIDGLEPYVHLHYPATDIPAQARALYLENWLRIIPDRRYTPARIVPGLRPDTGAPLDLSHSVLRSVSPIHLEYMANMGVLASMSISLVVRNRLWGLISCNQSSSAVRLPFELRSACEGLGRLASLMIGALEDRELTRMRESRKGLLQRLTEAMREGGDVPFGLLSRAEELLGLVKAEGAAVVREEEVRSCGRTPPIEFILRLAEWLYERCNDVPFATYALADQLPDAAMFRDEACGLLAIALPGTPRRWVLWFRPEFIHTVSWGGDPKKAVSADPGHRLRPRRSFEEWKERVKLQSARWTPSELEAAAELRRLSVEIDLLRQIEREQRAVRARDDLVAVVSHDLKSPLSVIQMHATLLQRASERAADVGGQQRAERILSAVERMNTLILDLQDLSKIEAGRFEVQLRPVAVDDLINDTLTIFGPLADNKQIRLNVERAELPAIRADRERVFQILANLLGNAIKFTPAGGNILLRAERNDAEVLFTVADSGPGIPEHQLEGVFDRFRQVRQTGRSASGLGLYIAQGIVKAHGGRIWVESPPGMGARFKFTLPMA